MQVIKSSSRINQGTPSAVISAPLRDRSEEQPAGKMSELTTKLQQLEDRLQGDFSMSEASKYATKKEIAKVRANIMRLKRSGEEA